jgi:hypothetical protein
MGYPSQSAYEQETLMSEPFSLPTRPEDMATALVERFNSGKLSELLPLYEPEAVLVKPDGHPIKGHTDIAADLDSYQSLGLPLPTSPPISILTKVWACR